MPEISQRLISYEMNTASTTADGEEPSYATVNLARDFSALNRCHIENTNSKGKPLVYRVLVKVWPKIKDQSGSGGGDEDTLGESMDADAILFNQFLGAGNNWVMRNGSVKTHAAREMMFKRAEISKKMRGAYDGTIHYCLEAHTESLLTPQVFGTAGQGSDINGGSWEYSQLIYPDDTSGAYIALTGSHSDEDSTTAFSTVCMPQLYLASRGEVEADSNVPETTSVAKHSILRKLLGAATNQGTQDELVDLATDNQDQPPYDLTEVSGDWGKKHELGRLLCGGEGGVFGGSVIMDVPFGIFQVATQLLNAADAVEQAFDFTVELLDVYEM